MCENCLDFLYCNKPVVGTNGYEGLISVYIFYLLIDLYHKFMYVIVIHADMMILACLYTSATLKKGIARWGEPEASARELEGIGPRGYRAHVLAR